MYGVSYYRTPALKLVSNIADNVMKERFSTTYLYYKGSL